MKTLASIFRKSVVPLLQEYFYEEYDKIRLVLGDTGKEEKYQFITKEVVAPTALFRDTFGLTSWCGPFFNNNNT